MLVQATSTAYQTFPQTRAGPAVLVMAVPIRVLMVIVLFGELADVQRMPRSVRTAQQSGRGELMTGRSAVNIQQRFVQSLAECISLSRQHDRVEIEERLYHACVTGDRFGIVPSAVSGFSYRQRYLSTFRINVPPHCDPSAFYSGYYYLGTRSRSRSHRRQSEAVVARTTEFTNVTT